MTVYKIWPLTGDPLKNMEATVTQNRIDILSQTVLLFQWYGCLNSANPCLFRLYFYRKIMIKKYYEMFYTVCSDYIQWSLVNIFVCKTNACFCYENIIYLFEIGWDEGSYLDRRFSNSGHAVRLHCHLHPRNYSGGRTHKGVWYCKQWLTPKL